MTRLGGMGLAVLSALALAGASTAGGGIRSAGDLDDSFGNDGLTLTSVGPYGGTVTASALLSDGKVVLAGYTYSSQDFLALRLKADGNPDPSFGGDGVVQTPIDLLPGGTDRATDVAVRQDGTIVLAGRAEDAADHWQWAFVRYRANGTLDTSFSGDGIQTFSAGPGSYQGAESVVVEPNGRIVAAGHAQLGWSVVRLRGDGSLDPAFGSGGVVQTSIGDPSEWDGAEVVQLLGDGRIVVGGRADSNTSEYALARYLPNGQLDATFGANGVVVTPGGRDDVITDLKALPDGKVVVVGFDQAYDPGDSHFRLARYLPNGALDSSFGSGGIVTTDFPNTWDAHAYSILVQADGKLVVAGSVEPEYWYRFVFGLARYNADGSLDTSFGDAGTRAYDFSCDGNPGYSAVLQPLGSRVRIVQVGSSSCLGQYHVAVIGVETSGPPQPQGSYRLETHSGRSIIPGTTRIDNRCNDCTTTISLPWTVWIYGIPYTSAHVSSNGNVQFSSQSPSGREMCLPWAPMGTTVAAYWDDLNTLEGGGIWTGVTGSPGARKFVIEWRDAALRWDGRANFEVVLTEGSPTVSIIHGQSSGSDADGESAIAGIQRGGDLGLRFSCWQPRLVNGLELDYVWEGELAPLPPPRPPAALPPPPPPPPPRPSARRTWCIVPRVVGQTLRRARARIRARHCSMGRIRKARSARRRGRVIKQSPRPGSRRPRGTRVDLLVSRGRR